LSFGFRVQGFGFRVSGSGFWVSGFGFRVQGFVELEFKDIEITDKAGFGFSTKAQKFRRKALMFLNAKSAKVSQRIRNVFLATNSRMLISGMHHS